MFYELTDTIVAIATPPGKGAIAVVRVSGTLVKLLISNHLGLEIDSTKKRRPHLCRFHDEQGAILDQVLLTWFPGPASYTGEDVIEISCHGSPLIARRIVESLLTSGARIAEPGEFTMRAYLNRKLDLAQAEAVRDLIDSQTGFQARIAREQLEGKLSRKLTPLKDQIIRAICHLETTLEFVEEDVEPESTLSLLGALGNVERELRELGEGYRVGRIVHEGIQVVVAGKTNTGKSSVFNGLVRDSRAIVTQVPGTTRDALTETINLEGVPTRLIDTAGIRPSDDLVESLGVEKSLEYLGRADLVLFVVDGSREFDAEDWEVFHLLNTCTCILVVNKSDLPARVEVPQEVENFCWEALRISALEGWGLVELREAILRAFVPSGDLEKESFFVTNIRHKGCLDSAITHLAKAIGASRDGLSEEFSLYDLRKALDAVAQITGETEVEDILREIFSTFCVGK